MSNGKLVLPDNFDTRQLCFVRQDQQFRELSSLCGIFGEEVVKTANTELLKSFGCTEEACLLDVTASDPSKAPRVSQVDQGWLLLKSFSLGVTVNAWGPTEEGESGISSKSLRSKVEMTPGAILTLSALMRLHPDGDPSGELNISFNNNRRGRR